MKRALITGAHKGLGLAWCRAFAQRGYEVVLTARKLSDAETLLTCLLRRDCLLFPKHSM